MGYQRLPEETNDELRYRVCSDKDSIGSWNNVANILNELLGNNFDESTYRKKFNTEKRIAEAYPELRKIEKERKKLQTEKVEYNKWLREESRDELIAEKIVEAINNLEPLKIPPKISASPCNKSFLLTIADCHYGIEYEIKDLYGQVVNSYSPRVFEERMAVLLGKVLDIIEKEKITELNVWELGDGIAGILRLNSQLMKLKYGVIDSTIRYADYLANWLNVLSEHVIVKFQMVQDSNHCQLRLCNAPKNAFPEENMSKVMWTILTLRLKENPNIIFIDNPTGMNYAVMSCYSVLGIHGEVKDLKRAIDNYSRLYQVPIDYLVGAHFHHSHTEEVGINSEVVSVRSLIGTDPYSVSLGVSANAGATLLCFDQFDGLICEHKIKL